MRPHSSAQEHFQIHRSGEGIGLIAVLVRIDQAFYFTSLRIDNCNAVAIPFFCFPIEPILKTLPSTTYTPFFTPTPSIILSGDWTICDDVIISGRTGDYYSSFPPCGSRIIPFSTGKRFPHDGIWRRSACETSHETFGFYEKEFLIFAYQAMYGESQFLTRNVVFWEYIIQASGCSTTGKES